jgi:hypothetical protein
MKLENLNQRKRFLVFLFVFQILPFNIFVFSEDEKEKNSKKVDVDLTAIGEIEMVRVGSGSVCVFNKTILSGKVFYKKPKEGKKPISDVEFLRKRMNSPPEVLDFTVTEDGSFQGQLLIVDHDFGNGNKSRGRAYLTLRAMGCEEKDIVIKNRKKFRKIKMKCLGR